MTGFDRTMYKLMVLCLAFFALLAAVSMYNDFSRMLNFVGGGFGFRLFVGSIGTVVQFLLSLCALYWVPKIIKKFFPEVA